MLTRDLFAAANLLVNNLCYCRPRMRDGQVTTAIDTAADTIHPRSGYRVRTVPGIDSVEPGVCPWVFWYRKRPPVALTCPWTYCTPARAGAVNGNHNNALPRCPMEAVAAVLRTCYCRRWSRAAVPCVYMRARRRRRAEPCLWADAPAPKNSAAGSVARCWQYQIAADCLLRLRSVRASAVVLTPLPG